MSFLTRRGLPTHHAYMETELTSLSYQKRQNMSRKLKPAEMDFSMTTQEPVEQTTICPTIIEVSLQVQA